MPEVERSITGLGYRIAPIDADEDDDWIPDLSHVTPAYKRALWIVVLLNTHGVVEIVGGFLAGSQSVKADALDFIGDGVISFLGLNAVGWGLAARAKAALARGIFLGARGAGVLVATAYRVLVHHQPEARLMGILALIGLVPIDNIYSKITSVWSARSLAAIALNLLSAFGGIADMAELAAGSTRSRMTRSRPLRVIIGLIRGERFLNGES